MIDSSFFESLEPGLGDSITHYGTPCCRPTVKECSFQYHYCAPHSKCPRQFRCNCKCPSLRSADLFLGPIKMSEVRIPQLSLNFFIDFFFSSLVHLKPQCRNLAWKKKPQPPIMTTVFQFVIFLLFRSSTAEQKKLK